MSFDAERLRARLVGAKSERLMLREPHLSDAIDLFEATRHPAFNQHLMWPAQPNLAAVRQRVQGVIRANYHPGPNSGCGRTRPSGARAMEKK